MSIVIRDVKIKPAIQKFWVLAGHSLSVQQFCLQFSLEFSANADLTSVLEPPAAPGQQSTPVNTKHKS